jgi:hypothetical protein
VSGNGYQGDEAYREWQEERAQRVVKNEQAFRSYNERRADLEREVLASDDPAPFVCECGDSSCTGALEMTMPEFEDSHRKESQFAVIPGHVLPEFEEVISEHERYWVIRKFSLEEIGRTEVSR